MSTFKIIFADNNIRRLKFSSVPSYEEFLLKLKETYPSLFCGDKKVSIKYVDSDGDKISVSTQIEWEELVTQLAGENILKIFMKVEDIETEEKTDENEEKKDECRSEETDHWGNLLKAFQNVILEIPKMTEGFIEQCIDWEERNQVFINLHRMSLESLDSLDKNVIQKGKEMLLKMLEIVPNHAIALYNLACAESLLGNVKEALATLEKAINAGYHDLTHLINDKDFENIKNTVDFNKIVEKLQRILGIIPEQPPCKNEQEPEVIDCKEEEKKEAKVEEKRELSPEEVKINTLAEMFPIPKEILQELLDECKGNIDKVVEKLILTFN